MLHIKKIGLQQEISIVLLFNQYLHEKSFPKTDCFLLIFGSDFVQILLFYTCETVFCCYNMCHHVEQDYREKYKSQEQNWILPQESEICHPKHHLYKLIEV